MAKKSKSKSKRRRVLVEKKDYDVGMLTEDLMVEIMNRVPWKYLMRFRCVSKSFYSFIDSNFKPLFVLSNCYMKTLSKPYKYSLDNYCVDLHSLEHDTLNLHTRIHNPFRDHDDHPVTVIASCRGLLLMQPFEKDSCFAVLNPRTKNFHLLPALNEELVIFAGFGFDGARNTYKVVTMTGVPPTPSTDHDYLEFSIYDGTWRKLVIPFFKEYGYYMGPLTRPVCIGGAVYWYARLNALSAEDDQVAILGFDLAHEEFFEPAAPDFGDVFYDGMGMTVFDGRLCLVCEMLGDEYDDDQEEWIDIWVVDNVESDDEWSWTKLLSISEHRDKLEEKYLNRMVPICYSACRTKILFKLDGDHLCWYHLDKMEFHGLDEYNEVIQSNYLSSVVVNSFVSSLAGNGGIF